MEPKGLSNLNASSCYLNAIVQCLKALPCFRERIFAHSSTVDCVVDDCILCILDHCFSGYHEELFYLVNDIIPGGNIRHQQDAEEFLTGLFRIIYNQEPSLLEIFQSSWTGTTTCVKCKAVKKTSENQPIVSLPCLCFSFFSEVQEPVKSMRTTCEPLKKLFLMKRELLKPSNSK
ncbi:uncharacterized protein LOC141914497 [Tubulanus polymorphus]|uniref:uncharacterized protein LOC141898929 n=1 Tax=Tubulanus polymorphus TaxID=672921 RepID=UPI003DA6C34E